MAISRTAALLPAEPALVWETVTAVGDYTWRSDLSRTEVLDGDRFVEYTKQGYPTTFTTTVWQPCARWEFDMENARMRGHWTGLFRPADGGTQVVFTEAVTPKNPLLGPFVGAYLKKQQARFLADLKKALEGKTPFLR